MKHTISTTELSGSVGEIVSAVRLRGDCYVVSQRGKEDAALVPRWILDSHEQSRRRVSEIIRQVAASSNLTEDEAMNVALAEVRGYREEKDKRTTSPESV